MRKHSRVRFRGQMDSIDAATRKVLSVLTVVLIAACALAYQNRSGVPSVISDADQTKIRKMQLDDARISNAIQQRQLEINELQRQRDVNAAGYKLFVAGVCGKGFEFSQDNDVLSCVVEKPKEKK